MKITKNINFSPLALMVIVAALVVRVINLNYNSPFNDEAIYVVVGKMGLFYRDWSELAPFEWMAGLPIFYPPLSTLAHEIGGIVSSRFFNVIFFILTMATIHQIAYLLTPGERKTKARAALISLAVLGSTSSGYYVSRLATYDMPSFFFLALSSYFLIKVNQLQGSFKKYYFAGAVFLFISFSFKYVIGIFVPVLFLYLYFSSGESKVKRKAFLSYFVVPSILMFGLLGLLNLRNFLIYYQEQVVTEIKTSVGGVLEIFVRESNIILFLWALGSIGYFFRKKYREWLALTLVSLLIVFVHTLNMREHTFDKHVLLTVMGFSLVSGIGISFLLDSIKNVSFSKISKFFVTLMLILAWIYPIKIYDSYNKLWVNTYPVMGYIEGNLEPNSIVLTELGAVTTLSLFDQTYPPNVFTFDYIEYDEYLAEVAIEKGLNDGYFDMVILQSQEDDKLEDFFYLNEVTINSINEMYTLCYQDAHFEVYEKLYMEDLDPCLPTSFSN